MWLTCSDQGRVGDVIDELFDISSEYLGFITSNLAKVCCRDEPKFILRFCCVSSCFVHILYILYG